MDFNVGNKINSQFVSGSVGIAIVFELMGWFKGGHRINIWSIVPYSQMNIFNFI